MDDDHALLERLRAGDEDAFQALVERHDAALRRVARTFVRTSSAADEVVQETWLAVVRGLSAFEGRSSLRTWIFRILVNRARTRAVRDARSVPFSALESDDGPTVEPAAFGADGRWIERSAPARGDPETGLLSAELREHLLEAVDGLSPAQRAVITLRDLVGVPAEEVCELLELSDGNQRVLLHRARARVRAALAAADGGEPLMRSGDAAATRRSARLPRVRRARDRLPRRRAARRPSASASRRTSPSATAAPATSRTRAGSSARCTRSRSPRRPGDARGAPARLPRPARTQLTRYAGRP